MRARICYANEGNLVYTSTLDIQKLWERSARRAGLTLQYSQGFHPQPRIQIANPLALGFTGLNELVDIWFEDTLTADKIHLKLEKCVPDGIRINSINEIPPNSPSLPKQVDLSDYTVYLTDCEEKIDQLSAKCEKLLSRETIERIRNNKKYDLRPLILALSVSQLEDGSITLLMRLPTNSNKTGRPEEVMYELGFNLEDFKVVRDKLIFREQDS